MSSTERLPRLEAALLALALWPLVFGVVYLLLTGVLRWFGVHVPGICAAVALTLTVPAVACAAKPGLPVLGATFALCCTFAVLALQAATLVHDISYDGQAIHFPNAMDIAQGANPIARDSGIVYGDVYPNALWTLQGLVIHLTGGLEEGKAVSSMLLLACLSALAVALRFLRGGWSIDVAVALAVAAACPVLATQLTSFELDAAVYALAGCAVAGAILLPTVHRGAALSLVSASLLLLATTKLSGLYWAALIALGVAVQLLVQERRLPLRWLTGALAALLVVGWAPYVTAHWRTGRLFPAGSEVAGGPPNLVAADPLTRTVHALFGRVGNPVGTEPAQLKWPWEQLWQPQFVFDVRTGGFGPGLGLLVVGVLLIAIARAWSLRGRWGQGHAWLGAYWTAALLGAALLMPTVWWLRLSAPLWLALMVPLAWPRGAVAGVTGRALAATGALLAAAGLVASLVSVGFTLRTVIDADRYMRAELGRRAAQPQPQPVRIVPPPSTQDHSVRLWQQRLLRAGLHPVVGPESGCGALLFHSAGLRLCVDGGPR